MLIRATCGGCELSSAPPEFPAAFDAIHHSVPPSLRLLSHYIDPLTAITFQQSAETGTFANIILCTHTLQDHRLQTEHVQ